MTLNTNNANPIFRGAKIASTNLTHGTFWNISICINELKYKGDDVGRQHQLINLG